MSELRELALQARRAAALLAQLSSEAKDRALEAMARGLETREAEIMEANARDLEKGREKGLSGALLDRLTLNPRRIAGMARGLRDLQRLDDPVGEVVSMWRRPNGLEIGKMRVPLGVIGIIYEARPNVTVETAGICFKAGNAVILKGGSEALHSNQAIVDVIGSAGEEEGMPRGAVQLVAATERSVTQELMGMNDLVDVLIPRGGAGLIQAVVENATVPVIETGVGNCHVYVDQSARLEKARDIVVNAKTHRPGVCNAAETLLVDEAVAGEFLPRVVPALLEAGVELRGCPLTREITPRVTVEATEEDWATEYLDYIMAIRVVPGLEAALEHIARYGTGHSEAIVTQEYSRARRFLHQVDAAAVFVNASTRFTDGGEFGFGAEMGISTQKLHARGPMGLTEMTTSKYVVYGDGQVRS